MRATAIRSAPVPEGERLLLPDQVALDLGVPRKRIYSLVALGELKAARLGPRSLRIIASSVSDFINRHVVRPAGA